MKPSAPLEALEAALETPKPRVGISACLLGRAVRYDRGHARDKFLVDDLGRWVEWVEVCPEVEVGMGIPRPTIRLVEKDDDTRLVAPDTGEDFTERMRGWSAGRVDALRGERLDGFVLKSNSPSCGLERIKVYSQKGMPLRRSEGMWTTALRERWPGLALEEEGRLNDTLLREHFLTRLFAGARLRRFLGEGPTRAGLVAFHTAHKFLLLVHDEPLFRELGRVVSRQEGLADEELWPRYGELFLRALARRPTPMRHVNVLQHMLGFLKDDVPARDKRQVLDSFESYRAGRVPLMVPLTLMRFLIDSHGVEYLQGQAYLEPFPVELDPRARLFCRPPRKRA